MGLYNRSVGKKIDSPALKATAVDSFSDAIATTVVLAHNHPSGLALPSAEDVHTTERIAAALNAMEITLADHIVVADDDYVSMVHSGYRFDDCTVI